MKGFTIIASLALVLALVLTSVAGVGAPVPVRAAELLQEGDQPAEEQPAEGAEQPPEPEQPVDTAEPEQPVETVEPEQPVETPEPEQPVEPVEPVPPIALLPTITINIPSDGEVTSAIEVVVTGVAQALPENNVVVQAKDASGAVLDGRPTTVQAPLGGAGQWSVTLYPNAVPGTSGTIEAFSQSPATGEIITYDEVNVVFGTASPTPSPTATPTQPPSAQPALSIRIPQAGEVTDPAEIVVVGDGVALPENNVVVQALDATGALLDQTATTMQAPVGGEGEWRAIVHPNAEPGSAGSIVAFSTSPATGDRIAQATVAVVYGAAEATPTPTPTAPPSVSPFIEITIPVDGETTSNEEVVVVGNGASLPENNVVVEALDQRGRTLDRRATVVDAELGGEGAWRVTLYPNVPVGTRGRIVAYSTSPKDGATIASDEVVVTYGQYMPPADVTIRNPHNGAVLRTDQPISVSGTSQSIFENNVVVRVVSNSGALLAEQATTANSSGAWSVDVRVPEVNTHARVIAFSPSPVDGSMDAYDQVSVQLVGPQPTPPPGPHIQIASPSKNALVNTTHGFSVFGTASGTSENNVVVRVLDADGVVLRQIATIANADGNWNVAINVLVTNGTRGSITAFSTSPKDGSIEAEDKVNVTFASACEPRTDWPIYVVQRGDTLFSIAQQTGSTVGELVLANCISNPNRIVVGQELRVPRLPEEVEVIVPPQVNILTPEYDDVLSVDRPVVLHGEAAGITEGNVFVRALDNAGLVLDERRVEVTEPSDQNGVWQWQVDLDLFDAATGDRGTIFAYAQSAENGGILAFDTRSVIYGGETDRPWLTVESPAPYATVAQDGIVSVIGRGGGLFENNVVVELRDDVGNVLSIAPATVDTGEVGGSGFWEVNFAVDYVGRGFVVAYSPSPKDGSHIAEAQLDVFYGDPALQEKYVVITYPLPNTIVTGAAPVLSAAGLAGGIDPQNLRIVLMDANGRIIMTLPALVDMETGFWTVHLSGPLSIDRDQRATIHAIAGAGAVSASDVVPVQVEQPAVTGVVTYLPRIALPPDAVVHVMVQNTSIADAPPEVTLLGEQYITDPGQVPIPFAVKYNPADVDERANYGVRARIEDGNGRLLFMNTQSVPVLTFGNPSRNVEVITEQMP